MGLLPFASRIQCALENPGTSTRRLAGRLDFVLGNGTTISNWRSGYANIASGESYLASWTQSLAEHPMFLGENIITLRGMDVTPAPWNLPPYEPSGDLDTATCAITAADPGVCNSAGSGLWSDPGTWLGGAAPASGEPVFLHRGHVVTYDLLAPAPGRSSCGSLTIGPQAELRLAPGPRLLRVAGEITLDGCLAVGAGQTLEVAADPPGQLLLVRCGGRLQLTGQETASGSFSSLLDRTSETATVTDPRATWVAGQWAGKICKILDGRSRNRLFRVSASGSNWLTLDLASRGEERNALDLVTTGPSPAASELFLPGSAVAFPDEHCGRWIRFPGSGEDYRIVASTPGEPSRLRVLGRLGEADRSAGLACEIVHPLGEGESYVLLDYAVLTVPQEAPEYADGYHQIVIKAEAGSSISLERAELAHLGTAGPTHHPGIYCVSPVSFDIAYCEFHHFLGNELLFLHDASGATIRRNTFRDVHPLIDLQQGHGLWLAGVQGGVVEENLFRGLNDDNLILDGGTSGLSVRGNIFHRTPLYAGHSCEGITLQQASDVVVEENILYDIRDGLILLIADPLERVTIKNNLLFACRNKSAIHAEPGVTDPQLLAVNNLVAQVPRGITGVGRIYFNHLEGISDTAIFEPRQVIGNYVDGAGSAAVAINMNYGTVSADVLVRSNVLRGFGETGILILGDPGERVTVRHNTIDGLASSSAVGIRVLDAVTQEVDLQDNLLLRCAVGIACTACTGGTPGLLTADYNLFHLDALDLEGLPGGPHDLFVDPLLQDLDQGLYLLQSGSPAYGQAGDGGPIGLEYCGTMASHLVEEAWLPLPFPQDNVSAENGDGDLFVTPFDNCALVYNDEQLDTDGDGVGDTCDPD